MLVTPLRSDPVFQKMIAASAEKRADIYRWELMKPFKKKWDCYQVPLKALQEGGYDVVMASEMLGIRSPSSIDERCSDSVQALGDNAFWQSCSKAIERSLERFVAHGIQLPTQDYLFTILLANPTHAALIASEGYCGDGGIPGYILGWLVPTQDTLMRMPAALAHETNHNVRFQFIEWSNDITLAEMMVSEGLAENFAVELFGKELAGPWISKTSPELLASLKPLIHANLDKQGMAALSAYLYGDEIARLQGYAPAGLPYCAGYACGYHLVRCFLDETGTDIADATIMPAQRILEGAKGFWETT